MLAGTSGKTHGEAVQQNPGQSRQHAPAPQTESEFFAFADVGERIGATPAKLEKIRLLADYLRALGEEQLPIATTYFTGRAFPQSDLRTLQVGGSIIYRAMMTASKLSDAEFHLLAHRHGDAGKTASSPAWTHQAQPSR